MRKSALLVGLVLLIFLQGCNFPADLIPPTPGLPPQPTATTTIEIAPTSTATLAPTETVLLVASPSATLAPPTITPTPQDTATPAPTETSAPIVFPTITFNTNANCRFGPSKNYYSRTSFLTSRSTVAEGRNQDGSWLWVKASGGQCWVNVTTVKDPVSFTFLPVVDFPPLPESPSQLYVSRKDCSGHVSITVHWTNVSGETGYNLYRNGITLTTLNADATEYTDSPSRAAQYFYEIESFNNYGQALRFGQTVEGCP